MKNPRYANDQGGILLDTDDGLFYADMGPVYEAAAAGQFGPIAPFVPPPPPTPEEIAAQERAEAEANRQAAFEREADPLFFKWQAGEGTEQEWLAKREEIRARYPYPGE